MNIVEMAVLNGFWQKNGLGPLGIKPISDLVFLSTLYLLLYNNFLKNKNQVCLFFLKRS